MFLKAANLISFLFKMAPKRKSLSLKEKLAVLKELKLGKKQSNVAKEFEIARSTVQLIWAQRDKIEGNSREFNLEYKKVRAPEFPTVDSALLEWFNKQRSRNLPLSGPILIEKAKEIASLQTQHSFLASEGWFNNWKKRHSIVFKKAAGEESAVDDNVVSDWIESTWPDISRPFAPNDIFNADETGLFYRCLPDKTMEFKKKACHGGKSSKERLTLLLGANADGSEKLKPLLIGKSAKPRCFKGIRDVKSLPVQYENNSSAWMTGEIFSRWLKDLDRKMKLLNRKILLVLDNCTAHTSANLNLGNVAICFLPPNVTSKLQPMDRGIINATKIKYRTQLLKKIIARIDHGQSPSIDVLEAIYGISTAWNSVSQSTIANCFRNSGLLNQDTVEVITEEADLEISVHDIQRRFHMEDFRFEDYVSVDDNLEVCLEPTIEEIAISHASQTSPESDEDTDDDTILDSNSDEQTGVINTSAAISNILALKKFVSCHGGSNDLLINLDSLERFVLDENVKSLKQTKITSFVLPSNQ